MSNHPKNDTQKRILLILSGMSPQVVTGTLYGIMQDTDLGGMPDEIHLLATQAGAQEARAKLLDGPGNFYRFCEDYQIDPEILNRSNIHVITDKDGNPLRDIRSAQDNEDMADFIMNKVRELTSDPDCQLHLSISGGRKTMSFYGGYALTIYGREQDILSHVLVSDGYEFIPDYFYPTPYSKPLGNNGLDAINAQVELTRIPYLRIRDLVPKQVIETRTSFRDALAKAQKSTSAAEVIREDNEQRLFLSGEMVRLPRVQYAVYTWFMDVAEPINKQFLSRGGAEAVEYGRKFITHLATLFPDGDIERTENTFKEDEHGNKGMRLKWLTEKVSEINKSIELELGSKLASKYKVKSKGRARDGAFFLAYRNQNIANP
jgi:CRISPR-associated protein (TIGR02584 family)